VRLTTDFCSVPWLGMRVSIPPRPLDAFMACTRTVFFFSCFPLNSQSFVVRERCSSETRHGALLSVLLEHCLMSRYSPNIQNCNTSCTFTLFIPCIVIHSNTGNTNKCPILQSICSLYYLVPTCSGVVDIFRELTPKHN